MNSVFINYRRSDSPDAVARIYAKLVASLRNRAVFYDHTSIELGAEFPDILRNKVTSAGVVLVIMGPRWVEEIRKRKTAQLDFVKQEICLALSSGADVVPVLVGNTIMPSEEDFADFPELLPLLNKNAKYIPPDPQFDVECDKLIAYLERTGPSEIVGAMLAGKYKVQRQIGEGGMGDVYVAEQINPVKRLVAVKLIKAGMDSKEVLARFDAERQALAVMEHPNVCKVIDAGIAPSGRSYFVMEYVKGVPITKFCDDRRMTPKERLELFITVCRGIQHAHQKGIIHRDIKPANVLVEVIDGKPVPKVIDFGLAKATGLKLTDKSFAATEFGKWVGTLEYSSPEQAEGRFDIDTLSDVYSLGVLLYEMLAGSPPFTRDELLRSSEEEMRRVIKNVEPAKPSTKLSSSHNLPNIAANRKLDPRALAKSLQGDLDWIVLKALDKAPERRYATPASFAEDIARYLLNEPISAGKPNSWLRFRKFYRRNQAQMLAAAAVFIVLLVGIIGTTLGYFAARKAEQQKDFALLEVEKQRNEANSQRDAAKTALEELRLSESRLRRSRVNQFQSDKNYQMAVLELKDLCESQFAEIEDFFLLGKSYYMLNEFREAIAQFKKANDLAPQSKFGSESYLYALLCLLQLNAFQEIDSFVINSIENGTAPTCSSANRYLTNIVMLASLASEKKLDKRLSDFLSAEKDSELSLDLELGKLHEWIAVTEYYDDESRPVADNLYYATRGKVVLNSADNSIDGFARIIVLVDGVLADETPFWCYVAVRPSVYDKFSIMHATQRLNLLDFKSFGEIIISGEGEVPPEAVTQKVAEVYQSDPAKFLKIDPIDAASEVKEKMDRVAERASEATAKRGKDSSEAFQARLELAEAYVWGKQMDSAEELINVILVELLAEDPISEVTLSRIILLVDWIGRIYYSDKLHVPKKEKVYDDILKQATSKTNKAYELILAVSVKRAEHFFRSQQLNKAIASFEDILETEAYYRAQVHLRSEIASTLAKLYLESKAFDKAINISKVLFDNSRKLDSVVIDSDRYAIQLAEAYIANGQSSTAIDVLEATFNATKGHGESLAFDKPLMKKLVSTYVSNGQAAKAIPLLEEVFEERRSKLGIDHESTLSTLNELAKIYVIDKQCHKAVALFDSLYVNQKSDLGENHPKTLFTVAKLAGLYQDDGQFEKAIPLLELLTSNLGDNLDAYQREDRSLSLSNAPDLIVNIARLAKAYQANGQTQKAVSLYQNLVEKQKAALGADHPITLSTMKNLADAYHADKQVEKAISLFEDIVSQQKAKLGEEHAETIVTMFNLATAYSEVEQWKESISLYERSIEKLSASLGANTPFVLNSRLSMGVAYHSDGQIKKAIETYEAVLVGYVETYGKGNQISLFTMRKLAEALCSDQQGEKATRIYSDLFQVRRDIVEVNDLGFAGELVSAGFLLLQAKQFEAAESHIREGLNIREKVAPEDWTCFTGKAILGRALLGQERHVEAEQFLVNGYEGMKNRLKEIPQQARDRIPEAIEALVALYQATNKPEEVEKWQSELKLYLVDGKSKDPISN